MSVLIKGMDMPKTCTMCWFSPICPVWVKEVSRYKGYDNRLPNCPLIEVPPHGRLIDADKLYEVISLNYKDLDSTEDFMGIGYDHCIADTLVVIRQASTIIEAEEEQHAEQQTGHFFKINAL